MENKWTNRLAYIIIGAVITMIFLKWMGVINMSYWTAFSPILFLVGLLIAILIISVMIGSVAYMYNQWRAKK